MDGVEPNREDIVRALRRINAAEGMRETAEQAMRAEVANARSQWGDHSAVFLTEDGLVWVGDYESRCVAITTRGERCRNLVFDQGQVWRWDGPYAVLDEGWLAGLLTKTCRSHDDARAKRYGRPETLLVPFDEL